MIVRREAVDQPDVLRLLAAADARSAGLYPAESRFGASVAALLAGGARFFVARGDTGLVVGCGGYVLAGPGRAEVKRLFVDAAARGAGVGAALMGAIEASAAGEAVGLLLLETGVKSAEAIRLYRRLGFSERGPFVGYGPDPLSVFMEKRIGSASGGSD